MDSQPIIYPDVTVLVCGAGGFIGSHLVRRLSLKGEVVVGVDLKNPEFSNTAATHFHLMDLREERSWQWLFSFYPNIKTVYQLAADMGGAGYIFTGDNDANVMHNSALINLHCAKFAAAARAKVFYSSSACIYPARNQEDPDNPDCSESSAYPAHPDSEYGWEKLFSERLYLSFNRNYKLNVRIARFHNIFGPEGTWRGGKEKAPAALCRKVIEGGNGSSIEIWGPGTQTRSFLFIDECLDGIDKLMQSDFTGPVNLGSSEMISINNLAKMIISISGKELSIKNIPGPLGVNGRNSDNALIKEKLGWAPSKPLREGIISTYDWIKSQVIL